MKRTPHILFRLAFYTMAAVGAARVAKDHNLVLGLVCIVLVVLLMLNCEGDEK